MFKKIKKIGISWALFIAFFSIEIYAARVTFLNGEYVYYEYIRMKIETNGQESFKCFSNIWVKKDSLKEQIKKGKKEVIFSSYSDILTVDTLHKYLEAQKAGVLEELKRLIFLASGKGDLLNVSTIQAVREHMFDHGHMGWYPFSRPYINKGNRVHENPKLNPRGIFNINDTILQDISLHMINYINTNKCKFILLGDEFPQGYKVNPSLGNVADKIITQLFSNNINNPVFVCEPNDSKNYNGLIKIDVTYAGEAIEGLNHYIGLQTDSTPTNRVRIQVGVKNGRISISTIYPLG